jgi:hypothetical protein
MGDEIEVVGGEYEFKINGFLYNLKGHPNIEYGGKHYESIIGPGGVLLGNKCVGDSPSKISVVLTDTSDLDIVELQHVRKATITLKKPNGKTFVMENASCSAQITESCEEGEVSCEFSAGPASDQNS